MAPVTFTEAIRTQMLANWEVGMKVGHSDISAVIGYALGCGCELAMMFYIILASPK